MGRKIQEEVHRRRSENSIAAVAAKAEISKKDAEKAEVALM